MLEIEVKFHSVDFNRVRKRCRTAKGQYLGCHFESNEIFDTADRALRSREILLRLRYKWGENGQSAKLTLKCPAYGSWKDKISLGVGGVHAKVREEHEVTVDDASVMATILAGLGYTLSSRYEKIREVWQLGMVYVCLDCLPFGDFVELEGPAGKLRTMADILGLDWQVATTDTYHTLYCNYRQQAGLVRDENCIFTLGDSRLE